MAGSFLWKLESYAQCHTGCNHKGSKDNAIGTTASRRRGINCVCLTDMTCTRLNMTSCLIHTTECQHRTCAPRSPRRLAESEAYRQRPMFSDCWYGFCSSGRQYDIII